MNRSKSPTSNPNYRYPGIQDDLYGGMTDIGAIVKDAWALGVLPEEEGCAGWSMAQIQALYDQVHEAWEPYQHVISLLPPEMKDRYLRIHGEATRKARELGWTPPMEEL